MELHLTLLSDAAFATGEGLAGLLDIELQHDAYGLPYLRGRTLKGLLVEAAVDLLYSVGRLPGATALAGRLNGAAIALFGSPGQGPDGQGRLAVGDACLPTDLRAAVQADVAAGRLQPDAVLESLSAIRRQTAVDDSGAPRHGSLRSTRVLLRQTDLIASLTLHGAADADALPLLAACVLTLRRAGSDRNRGLGRVSARLWEAGADCTNTHWQVLRAALAALAAEETAP